MELQHHILDAYVGYNVGFDIEFLEAAGIVVTGERFDVMTAFASYRAGIEHSIYKKCKLTECAEYFGYSFNPHDAFEDAKATLYCFNSLVSDERFTTYKQRQKEQLQESIPAVKKKTRFTVAFSGGLWRSILLGLLLLGIGVTVISMLSNIVPKDIDSIKLMLLYAKDNLTSDPKVIISTIAVVFGCLMVIVRMLRMIVIFPKWVVVHIQRLFMRFK